MNRGNPPVKKGKAGMNGMLLSIHFCGREVL